MMITEMQEILSQLGHTDKIDPKYYNKVIEPAYTCSALDKKEWIKEWVSYGGLDAQRAWLDRDKETRKAIYIIAHQNGLNIEDLVKDFTEKEILIIKLQCGQLDPSEQQRLSKLL